MPAAHGLIYLQPGLACFQVGSELAARVFRRSPEKIFFKIPTHSLVPKILLLQVHSFKSFKFFLSPRILDQYKNILRKENALGVCQITFNGDSDHHEGQGVGVWEGV